MDVRPCIQNQRTEGRGHGRDPKKLERPEQRLWHRLALELGTLDVEKLKRSIGSRQFAEWEEYNRIEPIGCGGLREILGLLGYYLAVGFGLKKENGDRLSLYDIVDIPRPEVNVKDRQQSPSEMLGALIGAGLQIDGLPDEWRQ